MRTNTVRRDRVRTHEGALVAPNHDATEQLRRSVQACLLFEKEFYEDGQSIADRIAAAAHAVNPNVLLELAVEVRTQHNLRHAPLWLLTALMSHPRRGELSRAQIADAIAAVCKRADDPGELLAMYWKGGKRPLPAVLKRGLVQALKGYDLYQLAKYAQRGSIRLRDVMFLTHPSPNGPEQAQWWKSLADDRLVAPDTWEVALSAGADKAATFRRLLSERRLGALATLRNLRNMHDAGITKAEVSATLLDQSSKSGILPFQYVSAARAVPGWEDVIEPAMLRAASQLPRLAGRTILMVDTSGSMAAKLSERSALSRGDAAGALAALLREVCEDVAIVAFDTDCRPVPPRRGFALVDMLKARWNTGTDIGAAVHQINAFDDPNHIDRVIMVTDEQSATPVPAPRRGTRGYIMNVASNQNGVGYGSWTHVTGFSENIVRFIIARESGRPEPTTALS